MFAEEDLKLKKIRIEDVKEVNKLEQKIFTSPWSQKEMLKILTENNLSFSIVAEINDEIVGYAFSLVIADEVHIANIAVKEGYRRMKIGTRLLNNIIDETSNTGGIYFYLEVRKSNKAAIRLYEKFGFVPQFIKKKYYSDNKEDAIVMVKKGRRTNYKVL